MRSAIIPLLVSVLALAAPGHRAMAGMCISTGNGNWNNAATWSCGHVPTGGDTAIVAAGHTVSITQNHVYNGQPLHIIIYGVWYFSGGGSKITLPCGSHVEIMPGGLLQPNSNSGGHSETVRICGTTYWYYDQGAQGGYQIWPGIGLPVELTSFQATPVNGAVQLAWVTATERNSHHFDIMRSTDGETWSFVAEVKAQGNSQISTYYAHSDLPGRAGLMYYRLLQTDLDGTATDLGTLAVLLQTEADGIGCRPNPVTENHLMITSAEPIRGA